MAFTIILHLVALFSFPRLSDDIYRFIWDGSLWHLGLNPLNYLPVEIIDQGLVESERLDQVFSFLNSKEYYTVYPPIHQCIFYISTLGSDWSIGFSSFIIKLFILSANVISVIYLMKLLIHFNLAKSNVLIYALNPLIIVELTANAHFEAVMICFLILFFYALIKLKMVKAGLFLALSVGTKLLPLMFIPAIGLWSYRKGLHKKLFISFILFSILIFLPMFYQLEFVHFAESVNLYFQKFEFNASIYYLLREIGVWLTGYNQIAVIGPFLAFLTILLILLYAYMQKLDRTEQLIHVCTISFVTYLLLATTVHPWYLALPLALIIFRPKVWFIMWTGLIILSYSTYWNGMNALQAPFIALEYGLIFLFYVLEKKYPLKYS